MSATTDIPGMDRPIEEYVERWRHRHATERERHRRWAQQARHDAERIAMMLRQESGATRVILFGSPITGRFAADSDINLAVDGLAPADYFAALAKAGKLTDFQTAQRTVSTCSQSCSVDRSRPGAMHVISPERLRGVATDISAELERLWRGAEDIAFARAEIARDLGHARLFNENLAFKLHNFYTGSAWFKLLPQNATALLQAGFDRHRRLRERMGAAWGDRPTVLSGNSVEGLREFLAFRYVVKNLYGRELDAETDRTPDHLLPGGLRPEHR